MGWPKRVVDVFRPARVHPSAGIMVDMKYLDSSGDGRVFWVGVAEILNINVKDENGNSLTPKKIKQAISARGVTRGEFWAATKKQNRDKYTRQRDSIRKRVNPDGRLPRGHYDIYYNEFQRRGYWKRMAEILGVSSVDENGKGLSTAKIKSALYKHGFTKSQINAANRMCEAAYEDEERRQFFSEADE